LPYLSQQVKSAYFLAVLGCLAAALCSFPFLEPVEAARSSRNRARARRSADEQRSISSYRIDLKLDFQKRSYSGSEKLRWVNDDDHPASAIYLHLYPNLRVPADSRPSEKSEKAASDQAEAVATTATDEPKLEVTDVLTAADNSSIPFSLDDQETTLRINLHEPVPAGGAAEILLKFKGTVPEIDAEETGLLAHVVQQVGAALRSEREMRRARDINFRSRGVMMLGSPFPLLAARDGSDWQRKVEPSIGDAIFSNVADFDVTVNSPGGIAVYTSGLGDPPRQVGDESIQRFKGSALRDFAIVAGRGLRTAERTVAGVNVRSIYNPDHETVALKVLNQASEAVRVYTEKYGPLPNGNISIVDAPLVAGLGSAEFCGLAAIASAFYVNFDSPQIRNLPEIIREQRSSVEDSLEWTVAHVVAHQWWGNAVGNDPQRVPVLDEALANYSALFYYQQVHGEERAKAALDDQLRGVYKVYRTFGGEDMAADHAAREYRNFFQYSAIVSSKGALMFAELRRLLGDQRFFDALKNYYEANRLEVAELDDLKGAFLAEAPATERRAVSRTFDRWLSSKRGDEDIAPPDQHMAEALGLNPVHQQKSGDKNAFARLGKFFWQQMTRIR
jgi:hypothetical protein